MRQNPSRRSLALASVLAVASLALPAVAAVLEVPSPGFSNVLSAYAAVGDSNNTIIIQPGLYLEPAPALFNSGAHVILQPTNGRVILTSVTPPANDDFAARTALNGLSASAAAYNYAATINASDPLPRRADMNPAHFGHSLWWSWTAPTGGLFVVHAIATQDDFHPLVEVCRGPAFPPDIITDEVAWRVPNEIGFQAMPGTDYSILAGGENGATGQIVLSITCILPPSNDHFTNAIVLTGDSLAVQGTTIGATTEPGETNHTLNPAGHSVWFIWTAPTNDAVQRHPLTLSTSGSDFAGVLAVYTGTNVAALSGVTNLDQRMPGGFDRRFTFNPVPGATYHIALDGDASVPEDRLKLGNYRLQFNYSLVNLESVFAPTTPPAYDGPSGFQAHFNAQNYGPSATGPLQVRLVARSGESRPGIHRAPLPGEQPLGVLTSLFPEGLEPGHLARFPVTGDVFTNCPAPFVRNGRTNLWGVFAILEEKLGDTWVPIDSDFLFYGNAFETGPPILSYGPPPPTALTQATLGTNSIGAKEILLPAPASEHSSNQLALRVQLKPSGKIIWASNATWKAASGVPLTTNGVLRLLDLAQSTSIFVTGRFNFSGSNYVQADIVPLYRRPTLFVQPVSNRVQLTILGEANAHYAIDTTSELGRTNTVWTALISSNAAVRGPTVITNFPAGDGRRFYRANRVVP